MRGHILLIICAAVWAWAAAAGSHEVDEDDLVFEDRHLLLSAERDGEHFGKRHTLAASQDGIISRVKRQLWDFLGLGSNSSEDEASTTTTTTTETPNELSLVDLRERRSTETQDQDEQLSNTIPEQQDFTTAPDSPTRRTESPQDDEDYDTSGSEGSAAVDVGSVPRRHGANTTAATAAAATTSPPEIPHAPGRPRFYRITLVIMEPWIKEFEDRKSRTFRNISDQLAEDISRLYESVPGKQSASIISIQKATDNFESKVTLDLGTDNYDKELIQRTLYDQIEGYQRIGRFAAKTDGFQFRDFGERYECPAHELSCRSGECLPLTVRCDGTEDCADGSDELGCEPTLASASAPVHPRAGTPVGDSAPQDRCRADDKVFCADGAIYICADQKCDGKEDCPQGDDEADCPVHGAHDCAQGEFMCDITRCIPRGSVCDGKPHCADGTDEHDCPEPTTEGAPGPPCAADQFACRGGRCIELSRRCDTVLDCEHGDDEDQCPCGSGEFECKAGGCIEAYKRCNGIADCAYDDSDERDCPRSTCKTDEFRCKNGHCIPAKQMCDTVRHCQDGSDEADCPMECLHSEFQCRRDRSCIGLRYRCDRKYDCADGSDEEGCDEQSMSGCRSDQFRCSNRKCLSLSQRCNGIEECDGGEDERNCPSLPPSQRCAAGQFLCRNGQCIDSSKRCNNFPDCLDRSDEDECHDTSCPASQFTCHDGSCIPLYKTCDGVPDCYDMEDERNCPPAPVPGRRECERHQFRCGDGSCVDSRRKCDGLPDCKDGSDEANCDCRIGEYRCRSGECIPDYLRCDGSPQCQDRSDEDGCDHSSPTVSPARSCPTGQFACHTSDQCIPLAGMCDGQPDCSDQSDEANCAERPSSSGLNLRTYPEDQIIKESREVVFQCRDEGPARARVKWSRAGNLPLPPGSRDHNGRLEMPNIQVEHSGNYVCEAVGYPDNVPGSRLTVLLKVEHYVVPTARPVIVCGTNEATCSSGECVPKQRVCDGNLDCSDGSDEMRCNPDGCEPNEFQCDNKKCVMKTWRCDSDDDCGDRSDEMNCATNPPGSKCHYHEFECRSGNQCIPKSFHCDGEVDCQDGSDESGCFPVKIAEGPKRMEVLNVGDSMTLTCRAVGVPTPVVVWRLNWGHIPAKCTSTSVGGIGTLVCPNIQESDQGAYSCEALNMRGREFAIPDTILVVTRPNSTCDVGTFNEEARHQGECISCFCFGVSSKCRSANLFTYQLPPPLESSELVSVRVDPYANSVDILPDPSHNLPSVRTSGRNGFQIYSATIEREEFRLGDNVFPYFAMPENYHHNQLKTYGGYLKYSIKYEGNGRPINSPDVILSGDGYVLVHNAPPVSPGQEVERSVRFFYGEWILRMSSQSNSHEQGILASREEIMMALKDVKHLLIKTQYIDGPLLQTSLTNIRMDSAGVRNVGQGRAAYVEECECPAGYSGLSCEECSSDYHRIESGPWLGICMSDGPPCSPGSYRNNTSKQCERCPCPHTNPSNQFARTCHMDTDGGVTCDCIPGYEGRRCQKCASGFHGNPFIAGDSCRRGDCHPDGSLSSLPDPVTGLCSCKPNWAGARCDKCNKEGTFHLDQQGCVDCFCMGVSRQCSSSDWYRQQVTAQFVRDTQDFKIVEALRRDEPISAGIHLDPNSHEITFQDFSRRSPDAHYWMLPSRFLGNKITSYGGNLKYTLRYVPTPGGQSSRNSAPDVQLISSDSAIHLLYFSHDQLDANRPQNVSVPLLEQFWQRNDGQRVDRAHLLMTLASLQAILIKATYTTITLEASLQSVSLDIAENRNTGQERALPVEQCVCPPGYRGLSCEECDTGYTRADSSPGLYLGVCEPCNCNGHSTECDPESGVCRGCRGYTTGEQCESCLPGYKRDPVRGDCQPDDIGPCRCDPRGSRSSQCHDGQTCECKTNVEGPSCDYCRPGTFHLSATNPEGCLSCFCMGVTDRCQESSLYRTQIPMQILDSNHGFKLTDNNNVPIIESNFKVDWGRNEIGYEFATPSNDHPFWSLPASFTGNKVTSYGGNLTFTQRFASEPGARSVHDADVVLVGNGISIYWANYGSSEAGGSLVTSVPLRESADWRRLDHTGPRTASRRDMLTVLSSLEYILIRASHSTGLLATYLSDVSMDTAVSLQTGDGYAEEVESCRCPSGYQGLSCETCAPGHFRNTSDLSVSVLGSCQPCPCNNNEESCSLSPDLRGVTCLCKPGFSGRSCDNTGPDPYNVPPQSSVPPPTIKVDIAEQTIKIVEVGKTVRFHCSARSLVNKGPIRIQWSKEESSLPRDRATDDGAGGLVIISAVVSDSGTYICTATDGSSYGTERATLVVGGSSSTAPQVVITPRYLEVREGEPVMFNCHATGNPLPTLAWTGGPDNPQATFRDGVFRIPSARRSDEAEYQCIGTNPLGTSSERTILYVREGPVAPTPGPEQSLRLSIVPPEHNGPEGDTVSLTCVPGSNALHNFKWTKVGSPDLPSTASQRDSVLTIHNANPADSGIYKCTVTSLSSGASDEIQARVSISSSRGPPTARIEPERQTVSQGMTAELRCITSAEPSAIQWKKVGESDLGGNVQNIGSVLRISSALVRNRGVYVCTIQNEGGTSQASAIVEVERREPPAIEIYPDKRQTIVVGGSALLQCRTTSGIPTPTVSWRRVDKRPFSPSVEELPNGVLRFNRVTTADGGDYTCEAQNEVGVTDATASLDINSMPTITISPPAPITVYIGQPVRLQCRAHGEPRPTVMWSRDRPGYQYYEPTNLTSETSQNAVYEITRASKADEGLYTCSARNKAGFTQDRVQLVVEESNDIDRLPERGDITGEDSGSFGDREPFTVNVGGSAELRCDFKRNSSKAYINWIRPEGSLTDRHLVRDGSLQISNVHEEDEGTYICEGYENGQLLFQAPARLVVNGPPRLQLYPQHQVVRPGSSARVHCNVLGSGPHSVVWTVPGKEEYGNSALPRNAVDRDGTLVFERIGPEDSGRYLCRARNEYGEADAVAEVLVQDHQSHSLVRAVNHEQTVREGTTARLHCQTSPQSQISWTHEGRPLPQNAVQQGGTLTLSNVKLFDAGRYECKAELDGDVGSDYINVRVEEVQCGIRCRVRQSVTCLPKSALCNNVRDCDDGSDESNCPSTAQRSQRETEDTKVELQILPSKDVIYPGDNLDVECSVVGDPGAAVSWTKVGSEMASNVRASGPVLRVTAVHSSNGGVYRCNANTNAGVLSEDYSLSIQAPPLNIMQSPPVETRTAAYGMTVVMDCRTDLEPPVKYMWSKQGSELSRDAKGETESTLTIMDVRAQDAGFYTCTAQNEEIKMDIPTVLVVTGVVPYFAQAPNSFMALPTLLDAYLNFNITISFKPERSDGLILYNGQQSGGSGDFVSLGLNGGFVEFRFDVGSGPAIIKSATPVSLGHWHTVRLQRRRKDGEMFVDGAGPYRGTAAGRFQGLDLVEPLYLGGVPDFRAIHRLNGHGQGFVGCISRLVVGLIEHELVRDATATEGVTTCETCAGNACRNNGVCQEAPTPAGYTCICPAGFSGDDCSKVGLSCFPGACGLGRCVSHAGEGLQCLCPIGRTGPRCEHDVKIHDLAFSDGAFAAYPTPKTSKKLKMTLRLNPADLRDSLIMYTAQSEDGVGDFAALSLKDRYLEFRFDAGFGTSVLRSHRELDVGKWVTVQLVRDLREARLSVEGEPGVSLRIHGTARPLVLQTPLYIGGYDTQNTRLAPGVNVDHSFVGCVSEVDVGGLNLHLVSSIVDSANVEDCSRKYGQRGTRESGWSPCHIAPCLNGGLCTPIDHSQYNCTCVEGFSGKDCDIESDMCTMLKPCVNGGTCVGSPSSYKCNCPLKYGGPTCNKAVTFSSQVSFSGDGWLELSRDLLPNKSSNENEVISVRFTSNSSNALVLWYGQPPHVNGREKDYLSLSIVNGNLEWNYELGSGPAHIRLDGINVSDGSPHTVVLRRQAKEGSIELDGVHFQRGSSGGNLTLLNTEGNIFIGGVPDMELMTGHAHLQGFTGCIHAVQTQNSKVLNLFEEAISASNVLPCSKSKSSVESGTHNDSLDYEDDVAQ